MSPAFTSVVPILTTLYRDYNHHPFGRHQLDDTLRAYIRLILQLLCFVLRAQATLDLPVEVKACLTALSQSDHFDVEEITSAIHKLLLSLWTREWTPSQANQFPDPTIQFVIHTQVNGDGSLKTPEEVTGIFAKLVYDMVCHHILLCNINSAEGCLALDLFVRVPSALPVGPSSLPCCLCPRLATLVYQMS